MMEAILDDDTGSIVRRCRLVVEDVGGRGQTQGLAQMGLGATIRMPNSCQFLLNGDECYMYILHICMG